MHRYLLGISVFVLEDGAALAQLTANMLVDAGASIVGPYGDIPSALRGLMTGETPACALLAASFNGISDFRVAYELRDKRIPFFFVTGLDPQLIPAELDEAIILERPIDLPLFVETVAIVANDRPALFRTDHAHI
jgi:hypothetical protein